MAEPLAPEAPLSASRQQLLERRLRRAAARNTQSIIRRPAEAHPPLSSGQRSLWFMEQFMPGTAAYAVAAGCRLQGPLDHSLLEQALTVLVERHEALRMRFPAGPDGEPRVAIDEPHPVSLRFTDLADSELPADQRLASAQQLASTELSKAFDLVAGGLFRPVLIRISPDDHAFLLIMHHTVADGWSMDILLRELWSAYGQLRGGQAPSLPEVPVQFGDYATWEQESLNGPGLAADRVYWQEELADVPPLELSLSRGRPAERNFDGAQYWFTVGPDVAQGISELGRQHGTTPFMTLLAAFQTLLARHSGQYDFAVGTSVAGRRHTELASVVGIFANMVAIRTSLAGDPDFTELMRRCRETVLDALTHQDMPFDQIVRDLNVDRETSRPPLFQVSFELTNRDGVEAAPEQPGGPGSGLTVDEFGATAPVTHYDMTLYVTVEPDGLSCCFTYRTDLFDAAAIERLATRFEILLRGVGLNPGQHLSAVPVMTPQEREQVTTLWPRAPRDRQAPDDSLLIDLFDRRASSVPDATAVAQDGSTLTYAQLTARSHEIARELRRRGAGPDKPVAICLPPSPEIAAVILGVLRAGSAYLPLDPALPGSRMEFILSDARAAILVTDAAGAAKVPGYAGAVVDIAVPVTDTAGDVGPAGPGAGPASLAYVIYTSGTTGTPKGVGVENRAIVAYLRTAQTLFATEPGSRYALLQSLSFDFAVPVFFLPLITGGCLDLFPQRISGYDLARAMREREVDYLKMTPSHLAALASDAELSELLPRRGLILAGEAAPPELVRSVTAAGRCAVFNSYGPTETVVAATTHRTQLAAADSGSVPIGGPLAGVATLVLDDRLNPVPPGVAGELYVGGDRLARGYLGQAGLTAQRFVPDPYGGPGGRLYRTGDLVRWLDGGVLEFIGRVDHQVKIRGYRVELGEIESALAALPGVAQAVADVRGPRDLRQLVGYLNVPEPDAAPDDEQIRSLLESRLPEYMVPASFVRLAEFPRQAHGKVNRAGLPDPDRGTAAGAGFVAPRNDTEVAIAEIWRGILEIDDVGVHDNFFTLGGHSLAATRVVAQLRRTFTSAVVPVSVMDMFKYPTIAGLADLVTSQEGPRGSRLLHELTPPVPDGARTLSFVCTPYGGAHASVFTDLAAALPPGYSLYAVEVPGRDIALAEESMPIAELAAACVADIQATVQGPLVIYGHCGPGGALAVAIALGLEAAGREIDALYLGGIFPVSRPPGRVMGTLSRLSQLDSLMADRNHANWLRGMGSDIAGLEEEQLDHMISAMRQDGRLAEDYFTSLLAGAPPRLRAPVISVVGERDPAGRFYEERFREWAFLSDSVAGVLLREAGHFFTRYRAAELAEIITSTHVAIADGETARLTREDRGPGATWWLYDVVTPDPGAPAGQAPASRTAAGRRSSLGRLLAGRSAAAPRASLGRFATLSAGQLISITGSTLTEFALPIWVYLRTGSLLEFGLLALLGLVPGIVVGPVAGAIVDRYDRRTAMLCGDTAAAVTQVVLLILSLTGALALWHIYLLVGCLSVALAFQRTAYFSAIPQIVPKRYLGHANGIVQTGLGTAQFIAPLIGVGLLALIGLRGILVFDVASYVFAIGVTVAVRFPAALGAQRAETVLAEIKSGLRFTFSQPSFTAMLIFFALVNLLISPLFVLLSPLVLQFGHLAGVGVVTFVGGLGGLVAGLAMTAWGGPRKRRMTGIRVLLAALGVCAAVTGLRPDLVLVCVGVFGISICIGITNGIIMTIIQTKIPQRMQGRVVALVTTIASVMVPLGFGVIAPYATLGLSHLLVSHWFAVPALRDILGGQRGAGLFYLLSGVVLLLVALASGLIPKLARFDEQVPDATPDDLLGLTVARQAGTGSPDDDILLAAASAS